MFEKLFKRNKKEETAPITGISIDEPAKITSEIKVQEFSNSETATSEPTKEVTDIVIKPTDSTGVKEETKEIPPLTFKEMKALKRSRYQESIMNNSMFKKSYVLFNKKTGQMAEIRAASSFHACNIIGWKKNQVRLIKEKVIPEKEPETTGSSRN